MKQAPLIYGLMAEFDSPEMLRVGAERAHAAGYRGLTANSPYVEDYAILQTSKKLHFNGDRPVLLPRHASRVLGVEHHAAVPDGVLRSARMPLIGEAVLHHQVITGERLLVIQVPVLLVEVIVLVVAHFNHAILHPKGVSEVLTHLVVVYLHNPVLYILPVEKRHPLSFFGCFGFFGFGFGGSDDVAEHRAGGDRSQLVGIAEQQQAGVRAQRIEQRDEGGRRLLRNYFKLEDPTALTASRLEWWVEYELADLHLRGVVDRVEGLPRPRRVAGRLAVVRHASCSDRAVRSERRCSLPRTRRS